jgi:Tfp pilus assembly protein PilE
MDITQLIAKIRTVMRASARRVQSFTVVELMIAVGVVAVLSVTAARSYDRFSTRARQMEALTALNWMSNLANSYYAQNGKYAVGNFFLGPEDCTEQNPYGFGMKGCSSKMQYTYIMFTATPDAFTGIAFQKANVIFPKCNLDPVPCTGNDIWDMQSNAGTRITPAVNSCALKQSCPNY